MEAGGAAIRGEYVAEPVSWTKCLAFGLLAYALSTPLYTHIGSPSCVEAKFQDSEVIAELP